MDCYAYYCEESNEKRLTEVTGTTSLLRVETCQLPASVAGKDEVNIARKEIVHRMDAINLGLYELQNNEQG